MHRLDHLVIAAPDLETAKSDFEDKTGVMPADGGPHLGLGTRNALVSFEGGESYLEIVAPDPSQPQTGNFGAALAKLSAPTILHWAVRVEGLPALADRARAAGLEPGPVRPTARETPDGSVLAWELLGIGGHGMGGLVPFYIDWLECKHPALTTPVAGTLVQFELRLPADSPVLALLDPLPDGVTVEVGEPRLTVAFDTPRQRIELVANDPRGFTL